MGRDLPHALGGAATVTLFPAATERSRSASWRKISYLPRAWGDRDSKRSLESRNVTPDFFIGAPAWATKGQCPFVGFSEAQEQKRAGK